MQYDFKFISYVFSGLSFSQVLGISFGAFGLWQALILFLILAFIVSVPGFLDWSSKQQKQISPLSKQQIRSSFMPSFIGIGLMSIGFLVGIIASY
jgi:hypothetical protein